MPLSGVFWRFLGWFFLTWGLSLLVVVLAVVAAKETGGLNAGVMVIEAAISTSFNLTPVGISLALSASIWAASWLLGRVLGLADRWKAVIAAILCGLGSWRALTWVATVMLGRPPSYGNSLLAAETLAATASLSFIPLVIGPAVADWWFRRPPSRDEPPLPSHPAKGVAPS